MIRAQRVMPRLTPISIANIKPTTHRREIPDAPFTPKMLDIGTDDDDPIIRADGGDRRTAALYWRQVGALSGRNAGRNPRPEDEARAGGVTRSGKAFVSQPPPPLSPRGETLRLKTVVCP